MCGQCLKMGEIDVTAWLNAGPVFLKTEALIQRVQFDVCYKDVTFATLNRDDFLDEINKALPLVDWEKAYREFRAAGEKTNILGGAPWCTMMYRGHV